MAGLVFFEATWFPTGLNAAEFLHFWGIFVYYLRQKSFYYTDAGFLW